MNTTYIKDWNTIAYEVALVTDPTGKPIDRGIRSTITALICLGFNTVGSCEGHPERRRSPYITLNPPGRMAYDAFRAEIEKLTQEERDQCSNKGLRTPYEMECLLGSFYDSRPVRWDVRIHIKLTGLYGKFSLENVGRNYVMRTDIYPFETAVQNIQAYREEMIDFGDFLKSMVPSAQR